MLTLLPAKQLTQPQLKPCGQRHVSLVVMTATGRGSAMGVMEWCMGRGFEGMSMMGGGMMDGPPLFLLLPVLFFAWLLFLGVVVAVGVWAVRQYREQNW